MTNPMTNALTTRVIAIALLGAVSGPVLGAQGNAVACATAQDSLAAGAFLRSAVLELGQCGPNGANALASLISQSAGAQLDGSGRFMVQVSLAGYVRSPVVVNAAITVAQGIGNSQIARLTAFKVLLAEFNSSAGMTPAAPGDAPEACSLTVGGSGTTPDYDAGLTPEVVQQMMSVASAVYHNAADDPVIRSAAFCLRRATHTQTPYPVATSLITLSYVCADKFKVHNANPEDVQVTWNSYHVPPNARTTAPILTHGNLFVGSMTDAYFRTDSIATARLYYGTSLIQTRANGGTACP